jgi:hypothetical protein
MKNQNPVLTNKHTDWDCFNYLLECNINVSVSLKTTYQLEKELNTFTTAIQEAAWVSTPAIKRKLKGLNFPKEIKDLITEKRKLRSGINQEIHMTKIFSTELVNSYPRRLKTLNKHQSINSSQNSLQIIAPSIHSGKLQNI